MCKADKGLKRIGPSWNVFNTTISYVFVLRIIRENKPQNIKPLFVSARYMIHYNMSLYIYNTLYKKSYDIT
jgi:hypothetical protein